MWPSGRRRSPAKGVGEESSRGFESLRLRHYLLINSIITVLCNILLNSAPTFAPTTIDGKVYLWHVCALARHVVVRVSIAVILFAL